MIPQVVQVLAGEDYTVYAYFLNGAIRGRDGRDDLHTPVTGQLSTVSTALYSLSTMVPRMGEASV